MKDFSLSHLNPHERKSIEEVLKENDVTFSSSLKSLGHTDLVNPHIQFTSDVPVKTLPYPVPEAIQKDIKEQIEALQEADIIERSISEWACPMLAVKKKASPDGTQAFRLALDLRLLNSMIRSSTYPLPRIEQIINNISSYAYFTTLDFPSAYHQIHLPEKYRRRLSFTTQWGTFSFKRLMFGLRSAASSFQMLVDAIIEETRLEGLYAYQDDIIVCSNSFQETIYKLKILFNVLQKYNITLSPKKSQFHQKSIDYLGFHIENHTVSPISTNITKITGFPIPKTRKHLKRFIGLCGFYRKLIPKYSKVMDPLIKLTSAKVQFKWSEEHSEVFEKVQSIFFSKPFLNLPDWSKPFYLNTDASGIAIAGVLLQKRDAILQPVSYFSKTLSPSEKNYPAIKLELMAIVKSVNAFKFYLYNRNFVILSDSKPIEHYRSTCSPIDLTTKWLMDLYTYDFTFQYIKGESNVLADYFSRETFEKHTQNLTNNPNLINDENALPVDIISPRAELHNINNMNKENNINNEDPDLQISNEKMFIEQRKDDKLLQIINNITSEKPSKKYANYVVHPDNGLLMIRKKFTHPEDLTKTKIVVPNKLKPKVLKIFHMPHFGIYHTYRKILRKYYWRGIYHDTKNYVLSCELCIKNKPHRIPPAPLKEMYIPQMPGELVSMDFLGPFSNAMYILTITDHFSKFVELFPLKNATATAVVNCLTKYFTTFGRPAVLMTDLGPQFIAEIYNNFLHTFKIAIAHSSSGHPQTQGTSERINTSIKSSIATLLQEGFNFNNALMIHKSLYNTTVHSSTGYTPAFLHFGRSIANIFDIFEPTELSAIAFPYEYYRHMSSLKEIHNKVYTNMKNAQNNRNQRQHKKATLRKVEVGDIVYMKTKDTFKARFIGPYVVKKKISDVLLTVQEYESEVAKEFNINIDRLLITQRRSPHLKEVTSSSNETSTPTTIIPPAVTATPVIQNTSPAPSVTAGRSADSVESTKPASSSFSKKTTSQKCNQVPSKDYMLRPRKKISYKQ